MSNRHPEKDNQMKPNLDNSQQSSDEAQSGVSVGSIPLVGQHASEAELDSILADAGWRRKNYGDRAATHAVCRHGRLVAIDADDHTCQWWPVLSNEKVQI